MKITSVDTFVVGNPWKNWVFVKLRTDEEVYGIGEAAAHMRAKTVEASIKEMRDFYLGKDPFNVEHVCEGLRRLLRPDGVHTTTISAIEVACWDIIGKSFDVPVHRLLGGTFRETLRAYANGWYTGQREPDSFAEKAREVVKKGYTALKFDPFGPVYSSISREELEKSIEIVSAVRDAVGSNIDILIEGHGRFDTVTAVAVGKELEKHSPAWFEEPVPSRFIDELSEISRKLHVPIAAGEGLSTREEFAQMLEKSAVGILQPDFLHIGGILEGKKICGMAQAHHAPVAPHNAQGPVSTAVCVQLDACTPNFLIQETFEDFGVPWASEVVENAPKVEGGMIKVTNRSGLGIDLNEEEAAKHPYDEKCRLDLFSSGWERRNLS